jgi:uncharacterized protein
MKTLMLIKSHYRLWLLMMLMAATIVPAISRIYAQNQQDQPNNLLNLPQEKVKLGTKVFVLWIASTPEQQEQGLMFVHSMAADHGMIFVFSQVAPQTFWMKNTLIPLDLIFLGPDGTIVRHYTMPPDGGKQLYSSDVPVQYAIEINAGCFAALHLNDGQHIDLPGPVIAPGG